MCWNATVSLNTWALGAFATAFALSNGVIGFVGALFIQSFVSMQLVEYFLWRAIAAGESTRVASMVGLALIALQPALSAARLLALPGRTRGVGVVLLAAYFVMCAVFAARVEIDFRTTVGSSGHLRWEWLPMGPLALAAWATVFIAPMLLLPPRSLHLAAAVFGVVTLLVSCYYGWRDGSWGTVWCWVASTISLVLIAQVFWKDLCLVRSQDQ